MYITKEELEKLEMLLNKANTHCNNHDCEKCIIKNSKVCKLVNIKE